jgi:hypothetical protein
MQRRNVAIVVGALLLVGLGGFGVARLVFLQGASATALIAPKPTTCADAYRVLKLTPSQEAGANPVCLKQTLQLSGEVVGAVGQAYTVDPNTVAPTQMCRTPKRWSGYPTALLAFVAGGKGYRLRISAPGSFEHQAMTLNTVAGVIDLASLSNSSQMWSQATGTLTLNADGTTGTIDASVLRDVSGAAPVRISGQWACGAPLPQPSFDASVPCAGFFALNQLQAADIARMKASACNPQGLVFSGAINSQLDHAITDTAISPHPGLDGDNFCGRVGEDYTAALKFSVGDESFLLDLNAHLYPAVGPGQYSAASGPFAAGTMLWLGHADASNQGAFVTDDKVFWSGSGGSFTINADMKSGTIDATLSGLLDHSGSGVLIKGTWRCAA